MPRQLQLLPGGLCSLLLLILCLLLAAPGSCQRWTTTQALKLDLTTPSSHQPSSTRPESTTPAATSLELPSTPSPPDGGEAAEVEEENSSCSAFEPVRCQPGASFRLIELGPDGCPTDTCRPCSPATGHRPECRGVYCPVPSAPRRPCGPASFLDVIADDAGCLALDCAACTPKDMGRRPGCRCGPAPRELRCPAGQFAQNTSDHLGCPALSCADCPAISPPRCQAGEFVATGSSPEGCPRAWCAPCTANTTREPACQARGCSEANKPDCQNGRQPVQQLLGTACHWVCKPCPPGQRPEGCPAGQFMSPNPAGHCLPWTCRDCDFQRRDLPACLPEGDRCPRQPDWALACGPGKFRRARAAPESGCLVVECADCSRVGAAADNSSDAAAASAHQNFSSSASDAAATNWEPAECRRACPQPKVLCGRGATAELGLDDAGCPTAACRPCHRGEACGGAAQPASCAASAGHRLDYEEADCLPGLFYLADDVPIGDCLGRVCLPCPAGPAEGGRPPGCQQLPDACAATRGLPNCTAGAQRVEQTVDASGCPGLVCADCPTSRPACPTGRRESPRPTKWLQCQLYDCRESPAAVAVVGSSSTLRDAPLDTAGCPEQRWRQPPVEFGAEWLQLSGGGCRLRKFRSCPEPPGIACRHGELPLLVGDTCQYACSSTGSQQAHHNWTSGQGACFPGQHYLIFLIDANRAKSPFQIRFQVASFIARLADQLSYGPNGVQIGALCYSGRVLTVLSPDDSPSAAAFFRRLLLLRYHEDSADTGTGDAVVAAANLLRRLSRRSAKRSLVVLTDSATNSGRSLSEAAAQLPAGTETYFVSLSSVWNPALRAEAQAFVSQPGNLLELTSYYALATSGVELLFPQCYRACDTARSSLAVYQSFVRHLQDSVHDYEAWLYAVHTDIAQLQQGLESIQYQFESKQIRLELCSRMVLHYKSTVQRLQQQLDSLQVMRSQAGSAADYASSLAQVRQLEQRLQALAARKAQAAAQLQDALARIGAAEQRVAALRAEQAAQIAAEEARIAELEARVGAAWKSLQTLTQELLLRRMAASNAEATVRQKEARIKDALLLNSDLDTRLASMKARIGALKTATNGSHVVRYVATEQLLTACQARADLDGFSPLLTIRASSGVRVEQALDALLRGGRYAWMEAPSASPEMELHNRLLNFTVGTYSQVRLVFRSSAGRVRAHLTFRAAAASLADFFSAANLVACFPWRLEAVKEMLGLDWSLRGHRFPSLLFAILTTTPPRSDAASGGCAGRRGLLAVVTRGDECEDLMGPYPRLRFAPSGQPVALAEMEDLDAMQLLAKPLTTSGDPNWLPGLVASADMPVTLAELLSNGMLAYPAESAPASLRPGLFYKSQLLRSRRAAFPLTRLRLTDAAGRVRQLVFNGTFERGHVVSSTWSRRLLSSARLFSAERPFAYVIGDGEPCQRNASGLLFVNLDNRCPAAADPLRGWSVLMSPQPDRLVDWSRAARAAYVEILLGRRRSLREV